MMFVFCSGSRDGGGGEASTLVPQRGRRLQTRSRTAPHPGMLVHPA